MNQISGKIFVGEELLATVDGHWVRALNSFISATYSLPISIQQFSVVIRCRIGNYWFRSSRETRRLEEPV